MRPAAHFFSLATLIAFLIPVLEGAAIAATQQPDLFGENRLLHQPQTALLLAQSESAAERLAKANRLLQQGIDQYQISLFREALQTWQQALELYQDPAVQIAFPQESRQGEGKALKSSGMVYSSLGQYLQAIDFYEQSLTIAREVED